MELGARTDVILLSSARQSVEFLQRLIRYISRKYPQIHRAPHIEESRAFQCVLDFHRCGAGFDGVPVVAPQQRGILVLRDEFCQRGYGVFAVSLEQGGGESCLPGV